jgi:hypothetical protein
VASALLFVALLVVVELSYRRWVRRASARRRRGVVDLAAEERAEATIIPMPGCDETARRARRIG